MPHNLRPLLTSQEAVDRSPHYVVCALCALSRAGAVFRKRYTGRRIYGLVLVEKSQDIASDTTALPTSLSLLDQFESLAIVLNVVTDLTSNVR
jgi:hypothetical protein